MSQLRVDGFEQLSQELSQGASERRYLTGGQLAVSNGTEVVSSSFGVDGTDQPIEDDSLFSIYCASKPIFSVLIGMLVDRQVLALDDRIDKWLPLVGPRLAARPIREILNHQVCLTSPSAPEGIVTRMPLGDHIWGFCEAGSGYSNPNVSGYSEFVGWFLLCEIIEAATGVSAVQLVNSEILEPLELTSEVVVDVAHMTQREVARIRTNAVLRRERVIPLLTEESELIRASSEGVTAYASMRGLVSLWVAALGALSGKDARIGISQEMMVQLTTPGPRLFDMHFRRPGSYGLGFMTDLETHGFGALSAESFGHVGFMGTTVVAADPTDGQVVAWHTNGIIEDDVDMHDRRVGWLRHLMVN